MKLDYAPQFEKQQQESMALTVILLVLFVFNGITALAIFALAQTGPIKPLTTAIGITCAVCAVIALWASWHRKL